jgi:dolichol kinase
VLAAFVMGALAALLWTRGAELLPAPYSLAVLAIYLAGILLTLTYIASGAAKRLERAGQALKDAFEEWAERAIPADRREAWLADRLRLEMTPEEKRKTPHLLMGIFLFIYVGLGWWMLRSLRALAPAAADLSGETWHNLQAGLDAGYLAAGHLVGITLLLGLLFVLLPIEVVRLRFPDLDYPFKGTIQSLLRPREKGLFGAHYYITATLPLAILWLTADPAAWPRTLYAVLAVLGITIFADAASALVGIRFGRRKWPHNPNKSYIGTYGGTVTALLIALPLVGLPMALVSAVVFFVIDVLAPVPLSASDNILNPLGLALAYTLLDGHLAPWLPFY